MNIKPLGNRVLIKRVAAVSESKIVIPESAEEKSREAVVVAVGPGRYVDGQYIPTGLAVGDRVMLAVDCFPGSKIKQEDGSELELVLNDEILAVI